MSNAVQTLPRDEDSGSVVPISDSGTLLQVISRAAQDPNVDIDKMERLLQMHERIMERNAKAAYTDALASMQSELPIIAERGEIKHGENKPVQSRYARWEDINEAIKPVMAKHGFALSFRVGRSDGMIAVTGVLSHREGHSEETTMHLPTDGSGSKNAVQAVGSSTSYGKRYTAQALLNLTSRGEDDDGAAAGRKAVDTITEEQEMQLRELNESVGASEAQLLKYLRIDRLSDLPAARYEQTLGMVRTFKRGA